MKSTILTVTTNNKDLIPTTLAFIGQMDPDSNVTSCVEWQEGPKEPSNTEKENELTALIAQKLTIDVITNINCIVNKATNNIADQILNIVRAEFTEEIRTKVIKNIRGEHLFGPANYDEIPYPQNMDRIEGEIIVAKHDSCYITNYGRIYYYTFKCEKLLDAGVILTNEVIRYLQLLSKHSSGYFKDCAIAIIKEYRDKFAFVSHQIHDEKIAEIRAQLRCELDDEWAKITAERQLIAEQTVKLQENIAAETERAELNLVQERLLANERLEFEQLRAEDHAQKRSAEEVEILRAQLDVIKKQLLNENKRLVNAAQQLAIDRKNFNKKSRKLDKKIAAQELGFDISMMHENNYDNSSTGYPF